MSKGYIYILNNPSLQPNFLKIGMTTRTPDLRAQELSIGTGMPSPYVVAYQRVVSNCEKTENLIHNKLKKYRITSIRPDREREFFNIQLKDAIAVIDNIIKEIDQALSSYTDIYVCIIFYVDFPESVDKEWTNLVLRILVERAYSYFRKLNAVITRETINEFCAIIPSCVLDEGEKILEEFLNYFQKNVIPEIKSKVEIEKSFQKPTMEIWVGLAQGKPAIEIESVKEFARYNSELRKPFRFEI